MRTRPVISGLAIALVVATVALVAAVRRGAYSARAGRPTAAADTPASPDHRGGDVMGTTLFRNMAKRENPVVVYITTERGLEAPEGTEFSEGDDFLQRFFG